MIHYTPILDSNLWMRKSTIPFDTLDEMKEFVADYRSRDTFNVRIPRKHYTKDDVKLRFLEKDNISLCMHNCHEILISGQVVGYCEV